MANELLKGPIMEPRKPAEPYAHQSYPTVLYGADGAIRVNGPDEREAALKAGFRWDSPAHVADDGKALDAPLIPKKPQVAGSDFDSAAKLVFEGEHTLDYTVNGMSQHFDVSPEIVRGEIEARVATLKAQAKPVEQKPAEDTPVKAEPEKKKR
jgi:hypothetical protein